MKHPALVPLLILMKVLPHKGWEGIFQAEVWPLNLVTIGFQVKNDAKLFLTPFMALLDVVGKRWQKFIWRLPLRNLGKGGFVGFKAFLGVFGQT